ncbi:hypothetical protein EXIGLDRAFT_702336 [Exidia glandulosa HHB12029]|uniref:F-box domain-containing protein n=1 Tax=Exidia glandulosa HHB12029 TaxID=1314781 RepID=A0A165LJM9_EXIGL|nr:hypothetical protein EXIGLDRAFT_702336 [Exidia glandulosa HHB12029]
MLRALAHALAHILAALATAAARIPRMAAFRHIPRHLESLYLSNHVDLTLPPLPYLKYISIHNSSVIILDGSKYDQLRTFELRETTSSIELDKLDQWAPALRNLLLPWDISMSEEEAQLFANLLQRVPPSVRILDVCVPVALQLSSFGAVQLLQINLDRWREDDLHDIRDIIVTAARAGTLKVVRIVSLDMPPEYLRKVIENMKLRVRVDFAGVIEEPSFLELDL